jgi:hypothetical protein
MGGGSYWLGNLVLSQASVFAGVYAYTRYAEPNVDEAGEEVKLLEPGFLWRGAGALSAAWLATFLYFVKYIAVPRLRHTLWSWTSGRQCVQNYFLEGKTDDIKFLIFSSQRLLWESDIGAEVKAWTAANWGTWRAEGAEWFKVELVPDEFIPAAELALLGHNRARRGSAVGSVRESFREVSVREGRE